MFLLDFTISTTSPPLQLVNDKATPQKFKEIFLLIMILNKEYFSDDIV